MFSTNKEEEIPLSTLFDRSMMFHSHSKSETPPPNTQNTNQQHHHQHQHQMASSSTMKSKPLHNFSLPALKWAMNHTNTHRLRKPSDPSHKSPQPDFDSDSETHNNNNNNNSNQNENQSQTQTQNLVFQALKKEKASGSPSSDLKVEKPEKKVTVIAAANHAVENNNSEKKSISSDAARSKIFIRFRTKNNKNAEEPTTDLGDRYSIAEFMEDSMPKTWNLRPRRVVTKCPNANRGGAKTRGESKPHPNSSRPELAPSKNGGDAKNKKDKGKEKVKDKKPRFSITLTKQEIEEDIFSMTGAKPSRRPKKRNKNVQKQLDCVFPGLWLSSITPDSYKVHDTSAKVKN